MLRAYQTLIRSDIDISYPGKSEQYCIRTMDLKKSPLQQLERYKCELAFGKNQYRDVSLFSREPLSEDTENGEFALQIKEVVSFHWHSGSGAVYYIPGKQFSIPLLRYWFLRGALIFYLLLEGRLRFLHAGAVRAGERSLLFSAHSHGGKSTLTDYFIKQGHPIISDDKVGVYEQNGRFYTVPAYPYHRPHRGIEDLGFFVKDIVSSAASIDVLYRLSGSEPESKITITELYGIEKFKALHFSNEFKFLFQQEDGLHFLARLAKQVPVYEVTVPWDLKRLPEVYEAIVSHSETLQEPGE